MKFKLIIYVYYLTYSLKLSYICS